MSLKQVIEARRIRAVYQPIRHLLNGSTVAHEALACGPEGPLHSPAALFKEANEQGLVFSLELARRTAALTEKSPSVLFLNADPRTLLDPAFKSGMTAQVLTSLGVSPYHIFALSPRRVFSLNCVIHCFQ